MRWSDGEQSFSDRILQKLGHKHGFEVTFSKDGSRFTPEYLEGFDVIVFYTSGDLTSEGGDGHPPMSEAGKQALLSAIRGGTGFIGLHSASDTFHTHESGAGNPPDELRFSRYQNYGEASDPFIRMLGGEFINHGPEQTARARVVNPDFPGFAGLGDTIELYEEWYSLKEFRDDLHVLLVMETAGMDGVDYERPPFPLAWARMEGLGRVYYNALGHREDVWSNPDFQSMLVGAIEWTSGQAEAEIPTNIRTVTPEADVFPPKR